MQYRRMIEFHLRSKRCTIDQLFDYYCERLETACRGGIVSLDNETGAMTRGDPRLVKKYEELLEALVEYA